MQKKSGDKIGSYEILAPIAHGGMGEVYRAKDTKLGRQVAIKVLPGHLAADVSARERLRREATAAAALDHPFICKVFEIGEEDGELFVVMEFISGDTLYRLLRSGGLPLAEALRISAEVAEALEEAHTKRFVHRDLKPANVMLTQGHVKVMDFGLAKRFEPVEQAPNPAEAATMADSTLTERGVAIGTPDYMSPEQVKGQPLDQRSDLFSFGLLLCELLGRPHPFRRDWTQETMAAILRDPPELKGDLPQGLEGMIRRLLAKSPDDRYQSMTEVRADLVRLMAGTPTAEPREEPESRIPLIGREAERRELLRHLDEALAGRGSLVMIGGEPGIGKTHLITSVLEEARQHGVYTSIGHCSEMEGSPPYAPFIEMLEYTARISPRKSFRRTLGDAASEIAKLMPELRQMYPDIPPAIQLPPEQQRRFLFNAVLAYIERGAKNAPLVLVFEDLHWADEPTLLLLQHIAQALSTIPLLMVGTYRDVEMEVNRPFVKMLETLLRQKQATRILLRRLPVGGVESMLAAMSGQTPPQSLARVVFEETEGNPFFVEEVFRHLSEEGKLFDETGQWRAGLRVDQLQVPEGVRSVLGRRLDRVGPEARRVLTTAAVIGRSFSLRLLEELENQQPDHALNAVEEAERAHLVSAEPAGRDPRYRFIHELVRQTLSETLSLPRRQRLHARVAEAIERLYAANLEAHASTLAHHLFHAGAAADPDKTTTYLMLAAKAARAGAAHEEALTHLENALSLCEGERGLRVAELTEQRAAALLSMGRRDEAVEGFRKAIELFESAGALANAAVTSLTLAMNQAWRIELTEAQRTVDRALESLGSAVPPLQMSLLNMRAFFMSCGGDVSGAASLLEKVKAQREAAPGQQRNAFDELSEMYYFLCSMQIEPMLATARRTAGALRAAGDLWGAAEAEILIPYELYCGRTAEAAARLPGVMQLAERVGHPNAAQAARTLAAMLNLARGDILTAEREMEEVRKFSQTHQVYWSFINSVNLGTLAFLRGDFPAAERWYSDRTEIEEQTYWAGWRDASLFAFRAESIMGSDPEQKVEANKRRAWKAWTERRWKMPRLGQRNPLGAWHALERSVIGLAWLGRKNEVAALRPLIEEVLLNGVWATADLCTYRTAAGIAAACAGDWSASEQHHLTAIHQTDTAPYRISQPMAREWYATMLLERSDAGDAAKALCLLSEAQAMYESMGMPFHSRRTRERLATLQA